MADKIIPDYAPGKPTAAQQRKRWFLMTGLVGGSVAAAAVRLALAQPTTTPVSFPGKIASPNPPATQPVPPTGISPPPATQPAPANPK